MKTIAIYNHKGGIGKSVTAINFSYNLTELGFRVLVIDMDPQGNASSFFRRYDLNKTSVREVLTGEKMLSRCTYRTLFKGLDIVPANIRLREVIPERLADGTSTLKKACTVYGEKYDYCIIDCPPSIDFLIETIMDAAENVIIPMKPDKFSADGLGTVHDIIHEFGHGNVSAGCLFTQFVRNRDSVKVVSDVLNTQEIQVYENAIRRCAAVDHSILVRRPLSRCASKSTAAQDYKDFTNEYLRKEKAYGAA